MNDYLERSKMLLGSERLDIFSSKTIAVIGVGGVGGTALESLARSGFKKFIIIDCDKVDVTNLNRQLLFTLNDVGKSKVDAAEKRIKQICPDIEIKKINAKIGDVKLESLLENNKQDEQFIRIAEFKMTKIYSLFNGNENDRVIKSYNHRRKKVDDYDDYDNEDDDY